MSNVFKEAIDNGESFGVAINRKKEICVEGNLEELFDLVLENARDEPE